MTGTHLTGAVQRLWAKSRIATDCDCRLCSATTDPSDKCIVWLGGKTGNGYGAFKVLGRMTAIHRFSYETHVGPIPAGLHVDHRCGVRACIAPSHLEPVTCRENLFRDDTPAARNAAKTHCDNGHEFTAENTYRGRPSKKEPNGSRQCRACKRAWYAAYRERLRKAGA